MLARDVVRGPVERAVITRTLAESRQLEQLEQRAMALHEQGQQSQALVLLFGADYDTQLQNSGAVLK